MDSNVIIAFLLTSAAGLSTMIGSLLIFIKKINTQKILASSLAFAAGVMITVSLTELLPESISLLSESKNYLSTYFWSFLLVSIGIILSILLDKYIPTDDIYENKGLYKIGIISMLAIILHNIPEGIITYITSTQNVELGISLAIAIAMHNIPEGISISVPIYYASKQRKKAILYTFISALSEPLGALLSYLFLAKYMNDFYLGLLFSLIAGIMLEISLISLLPTSLSYKNKKHTYAFLIIGILFMVIKYFK